MRKPHQKMDQLPQRRVFERFQRTARIVLCHSIWFSAFGFGFCGFCHRTVSVSSRLISQALPDDALQRASARCNIVNAELHAIAVAEIKFGQIPMQMLLFAVLIDAFHAALEDRIVALDGVGVMVRRLRDGIFVLGYGSQSHGRQSRRRLRIGRLVGHDPRSRRRWRGNRHRFGNGGAGDMEAAGRTAAFNKSERDILVTAHRLMLRLGAPSLRP